MPEYKPNEPELQVITLRQHYNDLHALNEAVEMLFPMVIVNLCTTWQEQIPMS